MSPQQSDQFTFEATEFLPDSLFEEVTEVRVEHPEIIIQEAKNRKRRNSLTKDGNLLILATDHPGRGVTVIRDEPLIMGNRQEYLARILRVLQENDFDGVMGTTDMIEDLFILNYLIRKRGGESFLDDRVILGCMNRGGVKNTVFEMDDTYTSFTADSLYNMRLDGGKMMYRLEPNDPGAGRTITATAHIINRMNELNIPVFLEPLTAKKTEKSYQIVKDYATLIRDVSVGAALGDSSRNMWLKIPYCEHFDQVAKATTCPIMMLGGAAADDPSGTINSFINGMNTAPSVRGALVGRNVTFPLSEDPLAVAKAIAGVIRQNYNEEQALEGMRKVRGQEMDAVSRYAKGGDR